MENTVMDGNTTTPQAEEKTFTQEQVNTFVQDRLTRERAKYDADMAALQTRATLAEKKLVLHRFDVAEDAMDRYIKLAELYPNDEGDFEKSLAEAMKDFPPPKKQLPRIVARTSGAIIPDRDPIRQGMGLNKKE